MLCNIVGQPLAVDVSAHIFLVQKTWCSIPLTGSDRKSDISQTTKSHENGSVAEIGHCHFDRERMIRNWLFRYPIFQVPYFRTNPTGFVPVARILLRSKTFPSIPSQSRCRSGETFRTRPSPLPSILLETCFASVANIIPSSLENLSLESHNLHGENATLPCLAM